MPLPQTPEEFDAAVLRWLLDERFDLWSVAELGRLLDDGPAVEASLARLRRRGLTYENDLGFVAASRAAKARKRGS
jgi:hypothetical protein